MVRQENGPAAERRGGGRPSQPAPLARGLGNRILSHEIAARGVAGPGAPLPHLDRLEAAFGDLTLRGVRAHFGAEARRSAVGLGARAYTFGEDIAFRDPAPSLRTVAHEAAHVIQQRIGVAVPQGLGRADDIHERQAEAVADQVAAGGSAVPLLAALTPAGPPAPVVQRITDEELADLRHQLTAALERGDLAAVFKRLSSRLLSRRSSVLRTLDRELAAGQYAEARRTAALWLGWKGDASARGPVVQGLHDVLDHHLNPPPPPAHPPAPERLLSGPRERAWSDDMDAPSAPPLTPPSAPPLAQLEPPSDDPAVDPEVVPVVNALVDVLAHEAKPSHLAPPHEPASAPNEARPTADRFASVKPAGYLSFRGLSWDAIRADYKRKDLTYKPELGPDKEGKFNLTQAQDAGAGMNVLLAFRLHQTLLKRDHQANMSGFPDTPSLLQRVHDELAAEPNFPGFAWNYGAGTESPTSDIDCNLSGFHTEEVVRRFNHEFRTHWGRESGIVFDVNVYARDFLPVVGSAPAANKTFQAGPQPQRNAVGFAGFHNRTVQYGAPVVFEVPLDWNSGAYDGAVRSERVYALVKTRMDMSEADWQDFKKAHLATADALDLETGDQEQRTHLSTLFAEVEHIVEERQHAIETRIATLAAQRPPHSQLDAADLDMRAQNELYAEKLAEVARLRARLANIDLVDPDPVQADLTDALHQALIFANESYVTGAAVQHVVLDKQMLSARQKDPLGLKPQAQPKPKNLKLRLTTERYLHSLHEQLGFAFREFELYQGDPEAALGKASKYIYRLGNAAKHIARDLGADIPDLEAMRAFGKHLLALKVTPTEAAASHITFDDALAVLHLDTVPRANLLAAVKARLIEFAAVVYRAHAAH